jgi:hypothetical protein
LLVDSSLTPSLIRPPSSSSSSSAFLFCTIADFAHHHHHPQELSILLEEIKIKGKSSPLLFFVSGSCNANTEV